MSLEKREHPEARDELRDAAFWYDDREPGLGEDFYDAIDEVIAHISEWPRSAPVFPGLVDNPTVRTMAVTAFPYRVLYYLTDTSFVILGGCCRVKCWFDFIDCSTRPNSGCSYSSEMRARPSGNNTRRSTSVITARRAGVI